MTSELAEIATIITSLVTLVIEFQKKVIIRYLRKTDAFGQESAVSFESKGNLRTFILRRMLKSGAVVQFENVYYLNESRIAELKKRRRKRALILVPVILVIMLAIIRAGVL